MRSAVHVYKPESSKARAVNANVLVGGLLFKSKLLNRLVSISWPLKLHLVTKESPESWPESVHVMTTVLAMSLSTGPAGSHVTITVLIMHGEDMIIVRL